jgi:DNA (cytosine-5)-methyltransferase 1
VTYDAVHEAKIPNHYSHRLSVADLQMVRAVPPGGNWKDIPPWIPSKRLEQIRLSYSAGKGSRSTYYGRLRRDKPAYTISTYLGRPGNGCFIHYDREGGQDRLISQREAARLQTFPDRFEFQGSKTSVNTQIGNAFPPLVAAQLGASIESQAEFVDLFCGAGGMSLGLMWAGWNPLVGTDIARAAVATYSRNVHPIAVEGDINNESVMDEIARVTAQTRSRAVPLWVVGGPPCQGFSTAGNVRSMDDPRNHLFKRYREVLTRLSPDGFLFENVSGLTNMEGGAVLDLITRSLEEIEYRVQVFMINAEEYGAPQRRHRLLIVGRRLDGGSMLLPAVITATDTEGSSESGLPPTWTTGDAIADLPQIAAGEDGSHLDYASPPMNLFQAFARGDVDPNELIANMRGMRT